jgi:hypothetical protein
MKASSLCGVETLAAFFVTTLQWQSISVSRFLPLLVLILTLSLSLSLSLSSFLFACSSSQSRRIEED